MTQSICFILLNALMLLRPTIAAEDQDNEEIKNRWHRSASLLSQLTPSSSNAVPLSASSRSFAKLGGCWDIFAMCADAWLPPPASNLAASPIAASTSGSSGGSEPSSYLNATMKRKTRSLAGFSSNNMFIKASGNNHHSTRNLSKSQKLIIMTLNYMGSVQASISPVVAGPNSCKSGTSSRTPSSGSSPSNRQLLRAVGRFCHEIDSLALCIDESSKSGTCRDWFVSQPELFRSVSTCLTACRHGCIDRCPDSLQKMVTLG